MSPGPLTFEPARKLELHFHLHRLKPSWCTTRDCGWPHGGSMDVIELVPDNQLVFHFIEDAWVECELDGEACPVAKFQHRRFQVVE